MHKVVEHFQSNHSAGLPAGPTVPLMEVVPPTKKRVVWFQRQIFNSLKIKKI